MKSFTVIYPVTCHADQDETMNTLGSAASNVISDVESVGANIVNVANKGSASILENINEVLGSPQVNEGITQAINHTKNIVENQD